MGAAGIIVEYNPLHSGHLRLLEAGRAALGPDTAMVCVMSGNFVQRGDFALLRKPGDSAAVPGLARGTAATAAYRAIPPAFLAEFGLSPALLPPGDLAVFEDSLHFLPAPALAHLPAAVRWQGMALGKASAQGLIPSARLRALLDPEPQRIPRLDVDDVPVLERLLQGGSLDTGLPGKEASLFWRGLPLGRLRRKAGRAVWSDR